MIDPKISEVASAIDLYYERPSNTSVMQLEQRLNSLIEEMAPDQEISDAAKELNRMKKLQRKREEIRTNIDILRTYTGGDIGRAMNLMVEVAQKHVEYKEMEEIRGRD